MWRKWSLRLDFDLRTDLRGFTCRKTASWSHTSVVWSKFREVRKMRALVLPPWSLMNCSESRTRLRMLSQDATEVWCRTCSKWCSVALIWQRRWHLHTFWRSSQLREKVSHSNKCVSAILIGQCIYRDMWQWHGLVPFVWGVSWGRFWTVRWHANNLHRKLDGRASEWTIDHGYELLRLTQICNGKPLSIIVSKLIFHKINFIIHYGLEVYKSKLLKLQKISYNLFTKNNKTQWKK